MNAPNTVLVFAASDPTGGAGIQADLLSLASLGCHGLSVLTGLTVQDSHGVQDFLPVDGYWITQQARCVLNDIAVSGFKIGVLGSVAAVRAVAEIVVQYPNVPLILDPVLASGRGDVFANHDILEAIRALLLPRTTLVTPNSLEARRLAEKQDLHECAQRLIALGSRFVLITGTHEHTVAVENTLYAQQGVVRVDSWPRLAASYHGSGCTLASAISAFLVRGMSISDAVAQAQRYTWEALAAGFRLGKGQHFPDRWFALHPLLNKECTS